MRALLHNLARRLSLVAILLAWTACSDEKEVTGPCLDCPFLVVQGSVLGADGPLTARVSAESVDSSDRLAVRADSTGAYRLLVPPGDYRLIVEVGSGYFYEGAFGWTEAGLASRYDADTLRLRQGDLSRKLDFHFGALECEISTPPEYLGRDLLVEAHGVGSDAGTVESREIDSDVVRFDLGIVLPGEYQVQVRLGHSEPGLWLPGSAERDGAAIVHVSALARTEVTATLPALGHLRGAVTGSWQQLDPDSEPRVLLFGADSTEVLYRQIAREDGSFDVPVMVPLDGRVAVYIDDYFRWIGGRRFEDATVYELAPGRTIEGVDLVSSALRVKLVLPDGAHDDWVDVRATVTDANKRLVFEASEYFHPSEQFTIQNLSPGTHYVNLQPRVHGTQDWLPQWFDGSRFLATATPIVIESEGSVTDVVFHPTRGGRLPIRIRRTNGFPVEYATLRFFEVSEPTRYLGGSQRADEDGIILVRGLRTGTWKIACGDPRIRLLWYPGTLDVESATPITIVEGEEAPLIEWSFLP